MTYIPLVHLSPKLFHPHDLGRPVSNEFSLPSLFFFLSLFNKLWDSNDTVHVNERIQNKSKTKSRHIQTDHAFYCSI